MAKQREQLGSRRDTRLTGRANAANQFRQPLKRFRDALNESRALWDRLEPEQRERIAERDPLLKLARQVYDELRGWFDG
jgi:hypothetical protein